MVNQDTRYLGLSNNCAYLSLQSQFVLYLNLKLMAEDRLSAYFASAHGVAQAV
jgi:hypothetical protein